MKKHILSVIAAMAVATSATLCGCGEKDDGLGTVRVYMPDGAPAVALSALMDSGYANTEFTVVTSDMITSVVSQKTADMAVMPINAAAKLFNNGMEITMLSVNTHGNMYMLGKSDSSVTPSDLVGKRIGSIGRGQVPDLTLRMMLDECEVGFEETTGDTAIDGKAAIRYPGQNEALPALLKQGAVDYAFMPEPAVSTAIAKFGFHIVMDAQEQWAELFGGEYPQACLVAQNSLVQNHPDYIDGFLAALRQTEVDNWAERNPDKAVQAVKSHFVEGKQSTLETLSPESIKRCNFSTVAAVDAYDTCNKYFNKLVGMSTGLPGGSTVLSSAPTDAFYYKNYKK